MNKFALLLCFLLAVNYSMCQDPELVDKYYDYLVEALKGFSKDGKNSCSNFFAVNRNEVVQLVKNAMAEMQAGSDLLTVAIKYVGLLINLDSSVATTCNLFGILPLLNKFSSAEEIKGIGERISSNSKEIYQLIQSVKSVEGLKNKMQYFGKILALVLNFYVY